MADTDTDETAPAITWPVRIKLAHPVEWNGERITALEVRRGRAGDLKGMRLGGGQVPAEQLITVAARLTGQPTQVIDLLDGDDAGEVMAIVLDFYGACLGGRTR